MTGTFEESVLRREDPPLLRGEGTFIGGLAAPELEGALHASFVRSIQPHARLVNVDISDASHMPGVVAILTGEDARNELWPLPPRLPMMNQGMHRPMLAVDVVRYVGEAVAVVIARTAAEALDAAEAVYAEYESLPPVVDLDHALSDEVVLHERAGTNVSWRWALPEPEGDPFAECDTVVELVVRHARLNPGPIEPRSGAASWGADGRLTTWVCSQRPAGAKYVMECAMGLEPGTVRAIAPDVGGGFGAKGGWGCYPEDVVIAWAARRLARPVRWTESRSEAMVAMGHGRASRHHIRIGGTSDGKVLAYECMAVQDSGAYPAMGSFITSNLRTSGTGAYDIPWARVGGTSVVTTTTPTVAFRGAGRPEAACDIERAMDRFASAVGLDPVEVRLRNVVADDAFPYRTAVGSTYDSGRYGEAIRRAVEASGYHDWRARQAERRVAGDRMQLGVGLSCTVEVTGGGEGETASVCVHHDGTVTAVVGTSPHGQGHETVFAEVVMAELGIDRSQITVLHGDTDLAPFGGGTIGSRSIQLGGSAVHGAARSAVDAAKRRAAALLEADEADVVFDRVEGRFHVAGTPSKALEWADLGVIDESHRFESAGTFAFGSCVAVVEVDTETGLTRAIDLTSVDDAGRILHHASAEGQVHGGLGLAVAAALYEEMFYDDDGVPTTTNFADYPIVSAAELPNFRAIEMETPTPLNPLGVKGIGESGTVVATPALHSAILDALSPFGVVHLDLPASPERVWRALQGGDASIKQLLA
jgi:carbon-monoxide dehydrogenase large subunit